MSTYEMVPEDPFVLPEDPDKVPVGIKAQMAFELRKAGASYELIAEKLNYKSANSVQSTIHRVLKHKYDPDDVEMVVEMELHRLDALQLVAWRRAKEGDLGAIDRILKIMERRSSYLGLDQAVPQIDGPITNNTAIFIGGDEDEYVEKLKQAREIALNTVTARSLTSGKATDEEGTGGTEGESEAAGEGEGEGA